MAKKRMLSIPFTGVAASEILSRASQYLISLDIALVSTLKLALARPDFAVFQNSHGNLPTILPFFLPKIGKKQLSSVY